MVLFLKDCIISEKRVNSDRGKNTAAGGTVKLSVDAPDASDNSDAPDGGVRGWARAQ